MLVSLLPVRRRRSAIYYSNTIGASGAHLRPAARLRALLPESPDPDVPALPGAGEVFRDDPGRDRVPLVARRTARRRRAHAHLGGLLVGYMLPEGRSRRLFAEIKYRYTKWKINRMRRKFDVYSGGRSDWDRNVH